MKKISQEDAFAFYKKSINHYYELSEITHKKLQDISSFKLVKKNESICRINEKPKHFYFVIQGLFRTFILSEKAKEYNKNFFTEGMFPGSMTALLKNEESTFEIQALEDSYIIEINFKAYRELLYSSEDLKIHHILYLEKNWLLQKDSREVSLVQEDAQQRYEEFLFNNKDLEKRLTQYHIASHLGITATQLSRIRKNQHM